MDIFVIAQNEFDRLLKLTVSANSERCAKARFIIADFENDEEYRVCFEGNTAVFRAGRGRALLYAVYDYFSRAYGVKYFWDGERFPEKKKGIVRLNFSDKPELKYRGLRYFAHRGLYRFRAEMWNAQDWKQEIDWILKKRFNMFMLRTGDDLAFTLAYGCHAVTGDGRSDFYDRTPFRSEEKSLALRKAIVDYAKERDLIMPVDCGAMTHWYSPTPDDYLKKYKPTFLSQSNSLYSDKNLLVWDIRDKKNLDAYFRLTDAYAERYGHEGLFHTIGLAERLYGAGREEDLKLKKYLYSEILAHNAEKYPDSHTLIGSWDFAMSWSADEVKTLVSELKGTNAILFDYVSDTTNAASCFKQWGVIGQFPYIFGIFHAYAPNDCLRGDYSLINDRLSSIVGDESCKGLVTWQELSHGDMLMLEFTSRNAWKPCPLPLDYHIGRYSQDRFGKYAERVKPIISSVMALASLMHYRHERENPERNTFRDFYLSLAPSKYGYSPDFSRVNPKDVKRNEYYLPLYDAVKENVLPSLTGINVLLHDVGNDGMLVRDLIDLARTVVARYLHFNIINMQNEYYSCLENGATSNALHEMTENIVTVTELLAELLNTSEDFRLADTWARIKKTGADDSFISVLKKNSANDYCRSQCFETLVMLSIPEERAMMKYILSMPATHSDAEREALAVERDAEVASARAEFYSDMPLMSAKPKKRKEILTELIKNIRV